MKRIARTVFSGIVAFALAASFVPFAYAAPSQAGSTGDASAPETDGVLVVLEDDAAIAPLSDDADGSGVEAALADANLAVTGKTTLAGATTVLTAAPTDGATDAEAAEAASAVEGVAYAQPNYVYELIEPVDASASGEGIAGALADAVIEALALANVNDPFALVDAAGSQPNQYWLYSANVADAWDVVTTDHDVTVATFDTGALLTHPDLVGNLRTDLAWDSYDERRITASDATTAQDVTGHGTAVAGIIAGVANNGVGVAGTSFNADIIPVKVFGTSNGQSSTAAIIRAYDYLFDVIDSGAADNVRVVNMSLGSYNDSLTKPVGSEGDRLLEDSIAKARDEYGIVTVCAGGNGNKVDTPNTDRIYPADFDECVAVTALEADGTNLDFSDYNEYKDISAPGESVWSTFTTDSYSNGNGLYRSQSGTSMASPIVAGTFALLFAAVPDATVDEACEAVYETATAIVDDEQDRADASGSHGALDTAAAIGYLLEARGMNHPAIDFVDVSDGDWFSTAVDYVSARDIMGGYASTGIFGPADIMTRAQIAQMLYNYYGNGEIAPATTLPDVDQDSVYARAINWVVSEGLMQGYTATKTFGPDDLLTREQLAIVLDNVSNVEAIADPQKIDRMSGSDDVDDWAYEAMRWAVGNGVINGVGGDPETGELGELDPLAGAERAAVAQVFMNAIERGIL